jgi:hypothetical protein
MRNPRYELPTRVRTCARAFHSNGDDMVEGWTITLELDSTTLVRIFIAASILEEERTLPNGIAYIRRKPHVSPGDTIVLEINLPVTEDHDG